jgi:hypothetical protein
VVLLLEEHNVLIVEYNGGYAAVKCILDHLFFGG